MMIIPKANLKLIYQNLLQEGVLVVKKDIRAPSHDEIPVPNLQVIKALQSLKSRGYVTEQFSWQYYYYFLTDSGILFLREYLHLPESFVPNTISKASKSTGRYQRGEESERRPRREAGKGEEGEYRRGGWRQSQTAQATA
jgi:small subunit ribosomal protein S10e